MTRVRNWLAFGALGPLLSEILAWAILKHHIKVLVEFSKKNTWPISIRKFMRADWLHTLDKPEALFALLISFVIAFLLINIFVHFILETEDEFALTNPSDFDVKKLAAWTIAAIFGILSAAAKIGPVMRLKEDNERKQRSIVRWLSYWLVAAGIQLAALPLRWIIYRQYPGKVSLFLLLFIGSGFFVTLLLGIIAQGIFQKIPNMPD